jgi:hypothetical protein
VRQLIAELAQHARPYWERLAAVNVEMDLEAMRTAAHALTGMAANPELNSAIEEPCRVARAAEAASLCRLLDASFAGAVQRLEGLFPVARTPRERREGKKVRRTIDQEV